MKHAHITVYVKPGQDIEVALGVLRKKLGMSGLKREMRKSAFFTPKRQRGTTNVRNKKR